MTWSWLGFSVGLFAGSAYACLVLFALEIRKHGWRNNR